MFGFTVPKVKPLNAAIISGVILPVKSTSILFNAVLYFTSIPCLNNASTFTFELSPFKRSVCLNLYDNSLTVKVNELSS